MPFLPTFCRLPTESLWEGALGPEEYLTISLNRDHAAEGWSRFPRNHGILTSLQPFQVFLLHTSVQDEGVG